MMPADKIVQLELEALRALCVSSDIDARNGLLRELTNYSWKGPDHRIVYEGVKRLQHRGAHALREQLPAEITRLGFPDVDCGAYFEGQANPAKPDLADSVRRLVRQNSPDSPDA